ncbi:hypothetical protein ABL78_5709 [Leptomonas seymouri]|uniref:B box-type domain-containing protein n=1 Tax=Leptomonas seymouri TaxID=5684 RepID=A0A0N0P4F2_LEPSE|nr:hypothetical protein ABL78_5709 [Leptomonas seymouri]|eukprot:KPI85226.1 hypothetical protein ABL78_5709 [Leptomonas seymouri]
MMPSSSPPPSVTHVRLVVYCDEEPVSHILQDVQLPRHLEGLKRLVEEKVGKRAKLLSYWNYTHNRYELLREVRELLQEEGRIPLSSPPRLRPQSRVRSGDREEGFDTSPPRSGASNGESALRQPSCVYRCQLWLETVLLQLEPLDARRDREEYDELRSHVARWLGNKHIGYEVQDAVRIRCPFLTRMFDETRSTRLEGNQDKVQLLYYSNNAWSVRDVLQYGFLLSREVPKSMTAVIQAQRGGSDTSTTTDTHLGIPVPQITRTASTSSRASPPSVPSSPADEFQDSQTHPFIFTSSMLGRSVKQLPAHSAPHKVLLCEVAPGRRFMTDQSLTSEHPARKSSPRLILKPPPGYDSLCYVYTRYDKASVSSEGEASVKAEDLSIVQIQVSHSYQALPRYLLTVVPTGRPPPPLSSLDPSVAAIAGPARPPGFTAAAAAAREDAKKQQAAAAASMPRSPRPNRLEGWLTPSPLRSAKRADVKHAATPVQHHSRRSAPSSFLCSTPPATRDDQDNYNNDDMRAYSSPRRSASAAVARHQLESDQHTVESPHLDYGSASRGSGVAPTPCAHSQPRPHRNASLPIHNRGVHYSAHGDGAFGGLQMTSNAKRGSPSAVQRMPGGLPYSVKESNGRPPTRKALQNAGSHVDSAVRTSPLRTPPSRSRGGLSLAPPTPPSPVVHGVSPSVRNGLLYSGLQASSNNRNSTSRSGSAHIPHQLVLQSALDHPIGSPERSSAPRSRSGMTHNGPPAEPSTQPLIPAYHSAAGHHDSNGGGRGGVPLPGALHPSSMMRRSAPAVSESFQRPLQAPPAAFNQFFCSIHPRQLQSLYCTACEELSCPYCASIGAHRDHIVVEASDQVTAVYAKVHKLYEELRHLLSEYRQTEEELRAEQSSCLARQQRELRTLQRNFQSLKQALQQTEHSMMQAVQQRVCSPPLAETSAVISKYTQALAPITAALSRYHAARESAHAPPSQAPPGQPNAVNGGRGTRRSVPETLQFLRTAPLLMRRVQEAFATHHQEEERRLRDSIASYRTRVDLMDGAYDNVDWVGLRKLLEHLGSSRSGRVASDAVTHERLSRHESPVRSFLDDAAGSNSGSAVRVKARNSAQSSPASRVLPLGGGDASRRLVVGRSPVRNLSIGDDLASYVSHRTPALSPTKPDRLLLRCLRDLQRGHIWAIQDASFYFVPGQLKAVCSTPFHLLGAQWELRIAPLPPSHRKAQQGNDAHTSSLLVAPGLNAGMMATTASTWVPMSAEDSGSAVTARSPLATRLLPHVDEQVVRDSGLSVRHGAPEEEWLGLFLFPQEHRLRMDFRVIAFSEVTWAEWQVTGWTAEMAGKGWGLYPFLQRKELMRTDKLARDNTVKICIAPISDLY